METINSFISLLRDKGYVVTRWDYKKKFVEATIGMYAVRVHFNTNDLMWSVATTLDHPVMGKNTTWRNFLTSDEVRRVILNEREHIGKPVSRVW